jgi:predicted lipid carrier protein YhbT
VYWDAVAGRTDPREVFLSGRAEVFGDVERALKMAMILHAFNTEFPYRPQEAAAAREAS